MNFLNRLELQIGINNIKKLNNTTVAIVGLGGVGSYAAESLVRSGIGKIILVDCDQVDITNINRQLMALHSNIGVDKTEIWEQRIKDINPKCQTIKINQFITKDNMDQIIREHPDYLIDACDTIETKKELIRQCIQYHIQIISSMGTGNKLDPSQLQIMDIRKTCYDPIAKIIRKMVKLENIKEKIPVICSCEQPMKMKSNILSSNAFVPATAGLLCTSYVINDVIRRSK